MIAMRLVRVWLSRRVAGIIGMEGDASTEMFLCEFPSRFLVAQSKRRIFLPWKGRLDRLSSIQAESGNSRSAKACVGPPDAPRISGNGLVSSAFFVWHVVEIPWAPMDRHAPSFRI